MGRQSNGSTGNINELERDVTLMLEKVKLPEDSIHHEQCIYKVPHKIRLLNAKAYTPRVVSIGPIHNRIRLDGDHKLKPKEDAKLKPMEDVKPQYLKSFLKWSQLSVNECVSKLKDWEPTIRHSYAEPIEHSSYDFLRMVLIDACFIIELFLRYYNMQDWIRNDPLFLKPWLANDIVLDLILLENQLPFFVLEGLYNLAIAARVSYKFPSFIDLTFQYFRFHNKQNKKPGKVPVRHFTDLLRTFMLPSSDDHERLSEGGVGIVQHLYSASQLWEAGLDFKVSPSKCLLDLKFHKGVLTMPCFEVYDSTEVFIRNIIAFEQCYHPFSPYIIEYIMILDFLINKGRDVEILIDKKVFVNLMGDDDAAASMVNNLGSNVTLPHINSKYRSLCDQLNKFYENPCNKYRAIFIHEYFNTPWRIASTIAAIMLLLLTLIQTICSIISLFKD